MAGQTHTTLIGLSMHTLGFERTKEALHHRVVIAVAFGTHAHLNLELGQHGLIGQAGVLAAPVGMVQQFLIRLASTKCHPKGRFHQTFLSMRGHCPAHDESGIDIEHHRQVQPAFSSPHGGNIGEPFPIRSRSRKIALQQIGSHRIAVATIGGTYTTLLLDRTQASSPHQAGDAMFTTTDAQACNSA